MNSLLKIAGFLLLLRLGCPYLNAQNGVSPRSICQSTCSGDLGENIFPDGDFGFGIPNVLLSNPGIAPGYSYTSNPPPGDGSYTIANNTSSWGSFAAINWINIEDNGPEPFGYMMVVNASFQPGLFYQKQVPVCENTLYEFSIDVISMNTPGGGQTFIQPNVAFEIDGNTVCSTNGIPVNATWQTFRFSFSTDPGTTQVTLSLRNDAPGGFGNDLAIDNISFRACGPDINVPATAFFCAGEGITLNASLDNSPYSPIYYEWQTFNPNSNAWEAAPNGNMPDLNVPQPGEGDTYRLAVASGPVNLQLPYCRALSLPLELTLEDLSNFAIGGTDTIVCNGAPALLEAGAFAQYQWSTAAQAATILAPGAGWYAVTVTTANGCRAEDSLYVQEVELTMEAAAQDPRCTAYTDGIIRAEAVLGGSGSVQFSLNDGEMQAQASFDSLAAGNYILRAVDSLGCTFPLAFTLNDPEPVKLSIGGDREIQVCDSLQLNVVSDAALSNYVWTPPDALSCTNCPSPVAMPLQHTLYTLRATDDRGCPGIDSARIRVLPRLDVYAPNVFRQDVTNNTLNNTFTLFPSKSATLIRRLEIFNRWGELVFRRENELPGAEALRWDGTDFRLQALDEGVYLWWAEIEFTDGRVGQYQGDVTLLRQR